MPSWTAVFRPRCWSGKKKTRLPRSSAQRSTAGALLDVQTIPPLRPTNAFSAAAELMYVTGTIPSMPARCKVGQDHLLLRRGEDIGALGHEVHAAKDDVGHIALASGPLRQHQRIAAHIGELDDVLALVVVAKDDDLPP